jgi:hypothetical protein
MPEKLFKNPYFSRIIYCSANDGIDKTLRSFKTQFQTKVQYIDESKSSIYSHYLGSGKLSLRSNTLLKLILYRRSFLCQELCFPNISKIYFYYFYPEIPDYSELSVSEYEQSTISEDEFIEKDYETDDKQFVENSQSEMSEDFNTSFEPVWTMFPAAAIPTPLGPPIIAIFRCQNGN